MIPSIVRLGLLNGKRGYMVKNGKNIKRYFSFDSFFCDFVTHPMIIKGRT